MIYECERRLQIDAAAEIVWQWMADVRRLLRLNIFHAAVEYAEPVRQAGLEVPIRHNILWLYRRTRIARIRAYRTYFVAWGELQEHGVDRFPHSQSFTVIPVDTRCCIVVNRLRGKLVIPGARYWFLPFYRLLAPRLLDYENRRIAVAVAAMTADYPEDDWDRVISVNHLSNCDGLTRSSECLVALMRMYGNLLAFAFQGGFRLQNLRSQVWWGKCLYKNIFIHYHRCSHDEILSPLSMYRDGFIPPLAQGGTQHPCGSYKI